MYIITSNKQLQQLAKTIDKTFQMMQAESQLNQNSSIHCCVFKQSHLHVHLCTQPAPILRRASQC